MKEIHYEFKIRIFWITIKNVSLGFPFKIILIFKCFKLLLKILTSPNGFISISFWYVWETNWNWTWAFTTANKCALPKAKTTHTTQANEINVCAQCTTDKGENSSRVKFQDKIKIWPNLFQIVLIALQCLIT